MRLEPPACGWTNSAKATAACLSALTLWCILESGIYRGWGEAGQVMVRTAAISSIVTFHFVKLANLPQRHLCNTDFALADILATYLSITSYATNGTSLLCFV